MACEEHLLGTGVKLDGAISSVLYAPYFTHSWHALVNHQEMKIPLKARPMRKLMNQLQPIGELFRQAAELPGYAERTERTEAERFADYAEGGLRVETTYATEPSPSGLAQCVADFKQRLTDFGGRSKRHAVNRVFVSWKKLVGRIDDSMAIMRRFDVGSAKHGVESASQVQIQVMCLHANTHGAA